MSDHTITFYRGKDDEYRVSVDEGGGVAVSAPISDPLAFIVTAAEQLDLEVDDSENADGLGPVTIGVPPGA